MDMLEMLDDLRKNVDSLRLRNDRVVIFVDRSNLEQSWRRVDPETRPDYVKIVEFLTGSRTLRQVRIYYSDLDYDVVREDDRQEWARRQDFYTFLRMQGWWTRCLPKKVHNGEATEKGLDVALARDMDAICRENRCDTVVLVAGDSDYREVVEDVRDRYCTRVEVAFFPSMTARDLQAKASKFINLDCEREKIIRKDKK